MPDESKTRKEYDLEERTARFGEAIVKFAKKIDIGPVTSGLISQVVRCGTSVGANYCEADEAESRKEFRYRIAVCKKEAKETRFQLRMIVAADPSMRDDASVLWQEAKELTLNFAAILRKNEEK